MRICIDKNLTVDYYNEEDKEILKKFSIYFSEKDDILTILDQKVDLPEDSMEVFLSILSCSGLIINLTRYSEGRYTLNVE